MGSVELVQEIFRSGAYVFMPSDRSEPPAWLNVSDGIGEPYPSFAHAQNERLDKPIVVSESLEKIKSWIFDLMLDQCVEAGYVIHNILSNNHVDQGSEFNNKLLSVYSMAASFHNINSILHEILNNKSARLVRSGRFSQSRKIQIHGDTGVIVPSLESLSSGQSSLLSIFATLLRYGDVGNNSIINEQIEGIVIVDEIDAHLHSDLQHDVLPNLISMFPKVQFIVSSHSPLFPLGMERKFGAEGFSLFELPTGNRITAERFSEFISSYEYLKRSKLFENDLMQHLMSQNRPIVICEGETDPEYLRTAAQLLGFAPLANDVDFEWIGRRSGAGADNGGDKALQSALKFLKNNPQFLNRPAVLFFDSDVHQKNEDHGSLFVRSSVRIEGHRYCNGGIEENLPEHLFEDRFFITKDELRGTTKKTVKILEKTRFCDFICKQKKILKLLKISGQF